MLKRLLIKKRIKQVLKKEKYFGLGWDKIQGMKNLVKEMNFKDQF